jgi:hypothetical protein
VKRDTRREVETGASGQIIINRSLGSTELSAIEGRTFCRLGSDDFYSWLLPLLVLKTEGIDLLTETEAVVDYEDIPALITAVSEGECDAAGIPEDALTAYEDTYGRRGRPRGDDEHPVSIRHSDIRLRQRASGWR